MPGEEIDDKPFTESTRTKLALFERYTREWLPVFLTGPVVYSEINVCDFFCGSGTDSQGTWGSALRILSIIKEFRALVAARPVKLKVYLSDACPNKIDRLRDRIISERLDTLPVDLDLQPSTFAQRFDRLHPLLARREAANLLIVDQYGVKHLDSTFDSIVRCPTTDFLAFVSSSWFQRFHSLPEVKRYLVDHRPEAYHLAHRVALKAYKQRLPADFIYYLGEFSLKSGSNIYGVVFGSGHPLGMAKFLKSAWSLDAVNGSANFDVEREGYFDHQNQQLLFGGIPKKIEIFEETLEAMIRSGACRNEMDVLELCFQHGVMPQHASSTIKRLKKEGVHQTTWWVPESRNHRTPRPLLY